ncbi:MAG TPA: amidohydrolase, partial [Lautropia sp.]|nr:amidohydrolase [Lautropia sp.]
MKLIDEIVGTHAEIRDIRRDIHAHPELKFEEVRTGDLVAKRLESWGIEVHRGLGITGLVGVIRGEPGGEPSTSRKAIGLRADMDALPMTEFNQFPHASIFRGKMHACGHDGHTAMLLGAAKHLAKHRDFNGTVYLIFQPGEEGGGGALAMMNDGLFTRFPMDAVFGMHNWPDYPAGTFGIREGPV